MTLPKHPRGAASLRPPAKRILLGNTIDRHVSLAVILIVTLPYQKNYGKNMSYCRRVDVLCPLT